MEMFNERELQLVNINIGLSIKFRRLKNKISQLELANSIDTNNTAIGRIERAEHYSSWDKVLIVAQYLKLDFNSLFIVKSKKDLITIVEECYLLDNKLTKEKDGYYKSLRSRIESLYN